MSGTCQHGVPFEDIGTSAANCPRGCQDCNGNETYEVYRETDGVVVATTRMGEHVASYICWALDQEYKPTDGPHAVRVKED